MRKELEIISDIVGINNRVVKKDVLYRKIFELDNIEVEQFMSNKGTIVNKYCTVIADNKFYKVNSSYEYIKGLLTPKVVEGFYSKSIRYEKDQKRITRRNKL